MRIHILNVARQYSAITKCRAHGAKCTRMPVRRRGDVVGVTRKPIPNHFTIDFRAARPCVLKFLKHHYAGAFAHDEPVAIFVPRPRSLLRTIIEIR